MLPLLPFLTAVLQFSTGGAVEFCQGGYECSLCTVTGPTVIDIHGQVHSVQDRCAYPLMMSQLVSDIKVYATFQERRRKDVMFLDHVILYLESPRVDITLEQGGRVQLDNVPMTLNATTQLVHGVELSKDQTGVTAMTSRLNYTITVFFDGYTAQIHIKGPSGDPLPLDGLCGNSSRPLREVKLSDYSDTGCETQYEDAADDTINCNAMTEHCNLLKEAPFTACHGNVDAAPYVAACNSTLCEYPAVDGLGCQLLEAYAKACSLYSDASLDGWRSKVNCSAEPQAFCQNRFCSDHEFCGENGNAGGTRCHCRAIFASPYRANNALGDAVVCNGTSRSVTLAACLLEDKGISYTDLHLYDKSCRPQMDDATHLLTLGFDNNADPCGTLIRMNNSEVINKNAVMLESTGEELMDFTCPFVIPDINIDFSVSIQVKSGHSSSSVAYVTTGRWNYTLTMTAYTDTEHVHQVTQNTRLRLNQKIWFELKAHGLDDKLVSLVTHSCFATSDPSPDSSLTYNLIMDGCANAADKTVVVEINGEGTANYFSFRMFQFSGKSGNVYLHCRLNLCTTGKNTSCVPVVSMVTPTSPRGVHLLIGS